MSFFWNSQDIEERLKTVEERLFQLEQENQHLRHYLQSTHDRISLLEFHQTAPARLLSEEIASQTLDEVEDIAEPDDLEPPEPAIKNSVYPRLFINTDCPSDSDENRDEVLDGKEKKVEVSVERKTEVKAVPTVTTAFESHKKKSRRGVGRAQRGRRGGRGAKSKGATKPIL